MFKLSRSIALMASVIPVLRSLSLLNPGAPVFTIEADSPAPKRRSNKPKRSKRGFYYPHSSARQRARYARQIAAGQLRMAGIDATGNERIIAELMADDPALTRDKAEALIREAEAAAEATPPCGEGLGRGNS